MRIVVTLGVFGMATMLGYQTYSQSPLTQKQWKSLVIHEQVLHFGRSAKAASAVQNNVFARRGDGSFVNLRETTSPHGEKGYTAEIIDLQKRRVVVLEPFTKSAITFYPADISEELEHQETCASNGLRHGEGSLAYTPADEMLGREVRQVRQAGTNVTSEKWIAPDLDCYPLQKKITSSRGSYSQHTAIKVEEVEPPDSMFEIPQGYIEVSPSQAEAAYAAKYPGHPFFGSAGVKIVEERYWKGRQR
ncbi:MAG: hypothetical protein KIT09_05925 [Bryobacteraceae bacterium]|nr:hypothetical protein [Bryobacteraceae bacterium]